LIDWAKVLVWDPKGIMMMGDRGRYEEEVKSTEMEH
jgi:hypothetical protein